MRILRSLFVAAASLFALSVVPARAATPGERHVPAQPLKLRADDGVVIYGAYYQATHPKALILLFHQADSSKNEYAQIAPRLVAAGYSALAIDQRSGGELFGRNETALRFGRPATHLDAKPDLEAALAWGERQGSPVILWGSSYSASLAFTVAAEHPRSVKAVLAFSPGEYFDQPMMVHEAAAHVTAPVYVTSASGADEISAARSILAVLPAQTKEQYVPSKGGVHGASTLLNSRNPKGAAANWQAVLTFLKRVG
jgi:dienelactone hydrolase